MTGNDGVIKLEVNGKEVSGVGACNPRKGYLALESEGAECHFRNLRIKELPSTNPKPDEIARNGEGFVPLYANTDLDNWIEEPGHKGHWQGADWVLKYDGKKYPANVDRPSNEAIIWKLVNPHRVEFNHYSKDDKITLSWTAVAGATAYKIYRGTGAGLENVVFTPAGTATTFAGTVTSET